jgi:hypothetical protein
MAREAVEAIVDLGIRRYGLSIYAISHPLLADAGEKIYSDRVVTPVYSGYRIRPEHRKEVLRRTIEIGVQTVTQLPSRYPAPPSARRRVNSLAAGFGKLADAASTAIGQEEVRRRIELYFENGHENRQRLVRGFGERRWCAELVRAVHQLKPLIDCEFLAAGAFHRLYTVRESWLCGPKWVIGERNGPGGNLAVNEIFVAIRAT